MQRLRYDAVIFDLFGTLVPPFSGNPHAILMRDITECLGLPFEPFEREWIAKYEQRGIGAETVAQQLREICALLDRSDVSESSVEAAIALRMEFFRRALVPRDGAVDVLGALRSRGLKIGLISDCSSEPPALWSATPLAELVDVAIFSCDAGCHKPDPRIYRAALDSLQVAPDRCLYVGDGMSQELSGARNMGMDAVQIRVPEEDLEEDRGLREAWDGPTVSSLGEVIAIAGIAVTHS
jgi:putative hydrolase of the HAD superfamily